MSTGGDLVFVGAADRNIYAYDAYTGAVRFQTRLPGAVTGTPITYAVNGRQFVAVSATGRGQNGGNALYVFAVPSR